MLISTLNSFTDGTTIQSDPVNQNFSEIRSKFNDSAVLTDVAREISVTHDWAAPQDFAAGTVGAPGIVLNGDLDTGFYEISAGRWGFSVGGSRVLDILSTGLTVTGVLTADSVAADLDADDLLSGTVPSGRLSGSYSGITGVGTLTSLTVSGAVDFDADPVDILTQNLGSSGQILRSTGSALEWVDSVPPPVAKVYVHSFSVSASGDYVEWEDELLDTDDFVDLVTNPTRITVDRAGIYRFAYKFTSFLLQSGHVRVHVNGVDQSDEVLLIDNDEHVVSMSTLLSLNTGDYIDLWIDNYDSVSRDIQSVIATIEYVREA